MSTCNLEYFQQFEANGIIIYPCKLLIIVHDCYTLRKPYIVILALLQIFKIPVRALHLLLGSSKKSSHNLVLLQQIEANGIIVQPYKLLIIVHDFYSLRKPYIAILALL